MNDIANRKDIELLINTFYSSVREDEVLGPIFNEVIGDKWSEHLDKMYGFWQTLLLRRPEYRGNPFSHHINLPLRKEHFVRWLFLFHKTLDENFKGDKVDEAKWRANKIAETFQNKMQIKTD